MSAIEVTIAVVIIVALAPRLCYAVKRFWRDECYSKDVVDSFLIAFNVVAAAIGLCWLLRLLNRG